MQGERSCELKRSVVKALAAVVAAMVTSTVPAAAWADRTDDAPAQDDAAPQAHAKKAKRAASEGQGKKGKRRAHRAEPESRRTASPPKPCTGTTIAIDRGGLEGQSMTLLDCHGQPREAAQVALSVLARPWGAQKPANLSLPSTRTQRPSKGKTGAHAVKRDPSDLAPGVRLLDEGLLVRLGAVAHHFPGRPISLVSGYRPYSRGSQHQRGRALDLRVLGVSNEELVAFCKTLQDTGCGYYPHSSFIHMDVRPKGAGVVTWIDTSGPGEAAHYVSQWPPPPEQSDTAVLPPDDEPHGTAEPHGDTPGIADPLDQHAPLSTAPPAPSAHGAGLTVSSAPASRP